MLNTRGGVLIIGEGGRKSLKVLTSAGGVSLNGRCGGGGGWSENITNTNN